MIQLPNFFTFHGFVDAYTATASLGFIKKSLSFSHTPAGPYLIMQLFTCNSLSYNQNMGTM